MAVSRPFRPNSLVPDIVPSKDSPLEDLNAQAEVGLRFYNGMRMAVNVIFRSGVEISIPPVFGGKQNSFYIRNFHALNTSVIVDTRRLLDDSRKYSSEVAESYHRAFATTPPKRSVGLFNQQKYVDFELTRELFDQNGGIFYLENLDILVSILNPAHTPRHPYTVGSFSDALLEVDPSLIELNSFHYRMTIVDRAKRFGSRFVNIHGNVYHVPAIEDSMLSDGVYVIRTTPTQGAGIPALPGASCYDFKTADKELGLWRSYNEALTLGDPNSVMKRTLDEKVNEAALAVVETKRAAQDHIAKLDSERREQDAEVARTKHGLFLRESKITEREHEMTIAEGELKHRLEVLRREQDMREKLYESGTLRRKERIEWLKTAPVVIGAIGAIAAAIKLLKSK